MRIGNLFIHWKWPSWGTVFYFGKEKEKDLPIPFKPLCGFGEKRELPLSKLVEIAIKMRPRNTTSHALLIGPFFFHLLTK